MSVLDRIRSVFKGREGQPEQKAATNNLVLIGDGWANEWGLTHTYQQLAIEGYMRSVAVYRAIDIVAKASARLDFVLYSDTGREDGTPDASKVEKIDNHPVLQLLRNPNPFQPSFQFYYEMISHLLLSGNMYLNAITISRGVAELYLIRPDRVQIPPEFQYDMFNKDMYFWVINPDGSRRILSREELLHTKFFNPINDVYGMSPLQAAALSLDQNNESKRWNVSMLRSSARPSGAFISEKTMTPKAREDLRRQHQERFGGTKNSGKTMILDGGLKWEAMSMTPEDMSWVEGTNMSAKDIGLVYGVPPELMGDADSKTDANFKVARKALYIDTVLPMMDMIIEALNMWLVQRWGKQFYLEFDKTKIEELQADIVATTDRISKSWQDGLLTHGESRQALGFDVIEEHKDKLYMQLQAEIAPRPEMLLPPALRNPNIAQQETNVLPGGKTGVKGAVGSAESTILCLRVDLEGVPDAHITLLHFPNGLSRENAQMLSDCSAVSDLQILSSVKIAGQARFNGAEDRDAIVWLVNSPELHAARHSLFEFAKSLGCEVSTTYAFNPHVTLKYVDKDVAAVPYDAPTDVSVSGVQFWTKTDRENVSFSSVKASILSLVTKANTKERLKARIKLQDTASSALELQIQDLFDLEREQVLTALKSSTDTGAWEGTVSSKLWQQMLTNNLLDTAVRVSKLTWKEIHQQGAETKAAEYHNLLTELYVESLRQYIAQVVVEDVSAIVGTTLDALKTILADSTAAGDSFDQIAAKIQAEYTDMSATRAVRIARTEVMTASNYAARAAAVQTGLKLNKIWSTTHDTRARSTHASLDGQKRALYENYDVGGSPALYPGDPKLPAKERINCRCVEWHEVVDPAEVKGHNRMYQPRDFIGRWGQGLGNTGVNNNTQTLTSRLGTSTATAAPAKSSTELTDSLKYDPRFQPSIDEANKQLSEYNARNPDKPPVTLETVLEVSGVPKGSNIRDLFTYDLSDDFGDDTGLGISLRTSHPEKGVNTLDRDVYLHSNGVRTIRNEAFMVDVQQQGSGIGTEIFSNQVSNARANGFSQIETLAYRDQNAVGYKVWPRLGYDAKLDSDQLFAAQVTFASQGKEFTGTTVQHLYQTSLGRTHWDRQGESTPMIFDLKDGSKSLQVHADYMAERAKR